MAAADVAARIIAALGLSIPELDTSVGSPQRKIIDVFAEELAESEVDKYLLDHVFDVAAKQGADLDDFCLPSGMQVATQFGLARIEEVEVGDWVLTHTGKFFPVLATSTRSVDEQIVQLRTWGQGLPVRMTGEHPVLVTKPSWLTETTRKIYNLRWNHKGTRVAEADALADASFRLRGTGNRRSFVREGVRREWVPARDIETGDILWGPASPPDTQQRLSDDLKKLYGWFISEGSTVNCGRIAFTFNANEVEYQDEVERLIRQEWKLPTVSRHSPNPNSVQVVCYSKSIVEDLRRRFGSGAASKHIDWDLFYSGEDLTPLLITMWLGDGTTNPQQCCAAYGTSSTALAFQVRELVSRMGMSGRWETMTVEQMNKSSRKKFIARHDAHKIVVRGQSAMRLASMLNEPVRMLARSVYAPPSVELDGYVGYAVLNREDVHYQGQVHNLHVDVDNSYVLASGAAVHNCGLFGFVRLPAQRAAGVLTFSRLAAADQDYPIPAGSQATTATSTPVQFATVVPAVLARGQTSVDVAAQAVLGGQYGNLAANTLVGLATPVGGVTLVNNTSPTTGGADAETDAALVDRFKRTVFRGLAGTEDMFLATALEDTTAEDASDGVAVRAKVLGASSRWREQVQVVTGGTATSSLPPANAKYIFSGTQFLGADLDGGQILTPGVHYTFDSGVIPPVVHSIGTALPVDSVYDLDFEYASTASRNDPAAGITNRVDVWVDGSRPVGATETLYFRTNPFTGATDSPIYTGRFVRLNTVGTRPISGNHFVPLAFGPLLVVPATITIGGTPYTQGTHFWVVHDDTAVGYGPTSAFGLEWLAGSAPTAGAEIDLTYTYNALPADVEDRNRRWALVTTDARAHQAKRVYLRLNFAVVFVPGYDPASTIAAVQDAITQMLSAKGFDVSVQVSDLTQAAHNVVGVDNIRFLNSTEPLAGGQYAIERVSSTGTRISYVTTTGSPARATDLQLGDNEVPVLYAVAYSIRAANSFRASS